MIRALLIEDDPDLQALIRYQIAEIPGVELVGISRGGLACLDRARELQPDVVILDLMVHNPGGPRLVALLRRACSARIYVWTAFEIMRERVTPEVDAWFRKDDYAEMLLEIEQLPPTNAG